MLTETKYEGYFVDELGNVYSNKYGDIRKLKPNTTRGGYYKVVLREKGKAITIDVHRLITETLIDNPNNLRVVNHIDGNKLNNHISNLEWCNQSDNHRHSYELGLAPVGDNHKSTRISDDELITMIYEALHTTKSMAQISREHSCRDDYLGRVIQGRTRKSIWTHPNIKGATTNNVR